MLVALLSAACSPSAPSVPSPTTPAQHSPTAAVTRLPRVAPKGAACATGSNAPATYTAKICITAPGDGSTVSADAAVTAAVTVKGTSPGVQHVAFYLDGAPLLEDFT